MRVFSEEHKQKLKESARKRHCNSKGYTRTHKGYLHQMVMGKVPEGCYVHHKDGNVRNFKKENLEVVTPLEHNRIHHGKLLLKIGTVWHKRCPKCKIVFTLNDSHFYKSGKVRFQHKCKKCSNKERVARRKKAEADEK